MTIYTEGLARPGEPRPFVSRDNEMPDIKSMLKDIVDEEKFKQRRQEELDDLKARRNVDLAEGRDFVKDFSLGRISQPLGDENTKLRTLLEGRLGGLNAAENAALREQSFQGLNQQRQGDIRDLRGIQGAQGIRGPAAGAQQQDVFRQAADRGSDLEQQLLLRNLDIKRQAAQDFQGEVGRQQTQNIGIQGQNLQQSNQEAQVKNAFPFLFANLGAQEAATATNTITSRQQLLAALFPDLLKKLGQGGQPDDRITQTSFDNNKPEFRQGSSDIDVLRTDGGNPRT